MCGNLKPLPSVNVMNDGSIVVENPVNPRESSRIPVTLHQAGTQIKKTLHPLCDEPQVNVDISSYSLRISQGQLESNESGFKLYLIVGK